MKTDMKHLIYTHSPITTRMCSMVVEHENISSDNLVWIYSRFEKSTDDGNAYDLAGLNWTPPKKKLNFLKTRYELKCWQSNVLKVCGDDEFVCYVPQTHQMLFQLLTSHPQCRGYYLIEEGLAAYRPLQQMKAARKSASSLLSLQWLELLWDHLNYGSYYQRKRYLQDGENVSFRGCFTWNRFGFPLFENRVELTCPFTQSKEYPDLEALVVLDAVVEAGIVSSYVVTLALKDMFKELKQRGIRRIGVKFHPETARLSKEKPEWWGQAIQSLEGWFDVSNISQSVVVEDLVTRDDMLVVVNVSSVGLYAGLMGQKALSIAGFIAKHAGSEYQLRVERLPKIWHDNIVVL